eukprot:COSAG02_NODE_41482_length_394_cov_0.793220_1_plen_70_part_00
MPSREHTATPAETPGLTAAACLFCGAVCTCGDVGRRRDHNHHSPMKRTCRYHPNAEAAIAAAQAVSQNG